MRAKSVAFRANWLSVSTVDGVGFVRQNTINRNSKKTIKKKSTYCRKIPSFEF